MPRLEACLFLSTAFNRHRLEENLSREFPMGNTPVERRDNCPSGPELTNVRNEQTVIRDQGTNFI